MPRVETATVRSAGESAEGTGGTRRRRDLLRGRSGRPPGLTHLRPRRRAGRPPGTWRREQPATSRGRIQRKSDRSLGWAWRASVTPRQQIVGGPVVDVDPGDQVEADQVVPQQPFAAWIGGDEQLHRDLPSGHTVLPLFLALVARHPHRRPVGVSGDDVKRRLRLGPTWVSQDPEVDVPETLRSDISPGRCKRWRSYTSGARARAVSRSTYSTEPSGTSRIRAADGPLSTSGARWRRRSRSDRIFPIRRPGGCSLRPAPERGRQFLGDEPGGQAPASMGRGGRDRRHGRRWDAGAPRHRHLAGEAAQRRHHLVPSKPAQVRSSNSPARRASASISPEGLKKPVFTARTTPAPRRR